MKFGRTIQERRRAKGLGQRALAERVGVSFTYISKIENGTRRLDVIEFVRIAEAIGSDPAEIVSRLQNELRGRKE